MLRLVLALWCFTAFALQAEEKQFVVWNNPPAKPQEFLAHHSYHSGVMNTEVGYNLYLPPGYDAPGNTNRYPVIYWCHGMGCHESIDQFPAALVQEAIVQKRVPPLIVVYVSGGSQTFYCDSPDLKWASETTITKELIPHIDGTYRTLATRDFRAIQGMSMGGFGSMRLALQHPELFSSVVAFAGGYVSAERLAEKSLANNLEKMFGGDTNRFMIQHPFTLARKQAASVKGRLGIKLLVGTEDFLLEHNRQMHATLEAAGLEHEYSEVAGVKHDLGKLSHWLGSDGLEFAVKHFPFTSNPDLDGPWVNPPTQAERAPGTEHHVFYSEAMHRPVGYNIYLPPNYYDEGAGHGLSTNTTRFPVVYYLHGMTDSESKHLYNVGLLDAAIRAGKLPPMICVWTYAGRRSWFTDYADGSIPAESVIVKELIPHIDARWRTLADRGHRSLHGWSMGGSGALRMGAKHAEMFSSVVAFSGGYSFTTPDWLKKDSAEQFRRQYRDDSGFMEQSAPTVVEKKAAALKTLAVRLSVGEKDFLLEPNRKMHALLEKLAIAHEYEELPALGHDPKGVWQAVGVKGWQFSADHFGR